MKRRNINNKGMLKKNKRRLTRINKNQTTPKKSKSILPDFKAALRTIQEGDLTAQKYPTMGYQMNQYMERADRNDPTCIRVWMDEEKRLDLSDTPQVIFTFGLGGCIATALCIEMTSGKRMVILTHNSPLTILSASTTLQELTTDVKPKNIRNIKLFIMAPGEYEQNTEGMWKLKVMQENEMYLTLLEYTANVIGGKHVEVERIAYSVLPSLEVNNRGTFTVFTGKDGKIMLTVEDNPSRAVFP